MHTKMKGSIGELAVAKYLTQNGFHVFTELGDLSKIDLIAEKDGHLYKIQVKATISKNGSVDMYTTKSGPNYHFRYTESDIDFFACYVLDRDIILWISSKDFLSNKRCMTFRLDDSKNGQVKRTNMSSDYSFERILRDYTPNFLPSKVEEDDIVQTTKEEIPANES